MATPVPENEKTESKSAASGVKTEDGTPRESAEDKPKETNGSPVPPPPQATELPVDVRTKLRKLERLESKYGELLKAYRAAHSRVQTIEPFEATLREYTPLTSISDPSAFVEYLGQVSAKGDMVLDEFKRVSAERDDFKKKSEQAEDTASQLRAEVADLKSAAQGSVSSDKTGEGTEQSTSQSQPEVISDPSSPPTSVKSPSSISARIPSISLFSPRTKPASPPTKDTSEDLFSYDSEVPRLEQELHDSQAQVDDLKSQMEKLRGDLTVARESTGGMVVSLESATRELQELRDAKDKHAEEKASLQARIDELEKAGSAEVERITGHDTELKQLQDQVKSLTAEVGQLQAKIQDFEQARDAIEKELETTRTEAKISNEKLAQKDATAKDLEDSLAMAKLAAREHDKQRDENASNEKKLGTMQSIMDNLRSQLSSAEATVKEVREEMTKNEHDFQSRPSTKVFGFLNDEANRDFDNLKTRDDVVEYLAANFGLRKDASEATADPVRAVATPVSEVTASQTSKKNKKKKKKGKGGAAGASEEPELNVPVKVSEDLTGVEEEDATASKAQSVDTSKLELEITGLKEIITSKDASIEKLSKQIKDQEALQEEIETLRDDLLHQGEEHVEARDRLKAAESERSALQQKSDKLEEELLQLRRQLTSCAVDGEEHKKVSQELAEIKLKTTSLQTDLTAAEQLAASRFKDLSDLREVMSKAQPELKILRAEVAELKKAKEDLRNKEGELKRLESRHDDLKAEMKGLGKRLSDKDAEIKDLLQKVEQETSTRSRAEEDLRSTQSELKSTEARRQDAVATSKEASENLKKSREEASRLRTQVSDLEERVAAHDRQVSELREQINLKTALHSTSQSMVQSLRDETHELNTQAREASTRAENLEEELAEAQRMLSERTREGQTMRMLLNQTETGTESRVREMKERMDAAIEERDRIEDEASVSSRRMMRELDEAKSKARDAQRALKILEDEKDELDLKQRDSKRRLQDLEQSAERATTELEDVKAAMSGLREALNESERQVQDMETQKAELRRAGDDAKERIDKLTKANKNLSDEIQALQTSMKKPQAPKPGLESGVTSSRASTDSASARSPAPAARDGRAAGREGTPAAGLSQGTVDYVYLKNVLLQFLERKDKAHQRQLIPVLGMLLHFDRFVDDSSPISCEGFANSLGPAKTSSAGCQLSLRGSWTKVPLLRS